MNQSPEAVEALRDVITRNTRAEVSVPGSRHVAKQPGTPVRTEPHPTGRFRHVT